MERVKKWISKWNQPPTLKKTWTLGVCVLIFLVEGREHFERRFLEKARVIAAKRDLASGTKLTLHDLTITLIERTDSEKKIFFNENLLHQVIGREIVLPLHEGEPVTVQHLENSPWPLFSKKIPRGYRAYLLKTQQVLPLEAGDRVDVVGLDPKRSDAEDVLIANRLVLGMKADGDQSQILLAVLPLEVSRLQAAQKNGELRLLLRNPRDQEVNSPKQRAHLTAKSKPMIEVWEEK